MLTQNPFRPTSQTQDPFEPLPIVDISGLMSDCFETRQAVAREMLLEANRCGFLYLAGHGISQRMIDDLVELARRWFAQDLATKMRSFIGSSANHSGYVPEGEEQFGEQPPDRKEAYDVNFDYKGRAQPFPMVGPNQWPCYPGFCATVGAYYDATFELAKQLFRGFALALGQPEDSLVKHVNCPPSQLRLLHYPAPDRKSGASSGIGEHTDYECFTLLLPTGPGLEVKRPDGEWMVAPVIADALVLNIGDMLEILSNGHLPATRHRVRAVAQERYAFPFFAACDYETEISPISGLEPANSDAPPYQSQVCGEHLYEQTCATFHYLRRRRLDEH